MMTSSEFRDSAENAGQMLSEYLQSRQSPVAREEEFREFAGSVEETREAADRLEAALDETVNLVLLPSPCSFRRNSRDCARSSAISWSTRPWAGAWAERSTPCPSAR